MKKNKLLISSVIALVIIIGGYFAFDYYAGNHIEINDVFEETEENETMVQDEQPAAQSNTDFTSEELDLNGEWEITEDSNVYLSIKTSKEEVNIQFSDVSGQWNINQNEPNLVEAEATVGITSIDSGNSQRDSHVQGLRFLDAEQFSEATFELQSIEQFPDLWLSGETNSILLKGDLTIKGITNQVTFEAEVLPENDELKLKAETIVTFNDFGMENPHTVVLDTENDVKITLQLVLNNTTI
ncbi:YceI family protein [Chengkuizengella axinellae]|uniref:YceI family protein n=1 Tax=Chengkuizengella axinellae TaxID=3064388 RepID=A0ABT9IVT7_9BACL|nr:YceI family protein [Chengkuizengella sp. 2205SS18-9]MDP5272924.1 YceI family protein [Chengkuizengella sp. 2205SS18-9]